MWSWWLYFLNYRLVLDDHGGCIFYGCLIWLYILNYRLVLDVVMVAVYSKL